MATKTISLKKEAYERLKKMKKGNESFSEVVMELTEDSKRDFSNIIGKKTNFTWKEVKESRKRKEEDKNRELLLGH